MKSLRQLGIFEETDDERRLGLGPYKRWFRFGWATN